MSDELMDELDGPLRNYCPERPVSPVRPLTHHSSLITYHLSLLLQQFPLEIFRTVGKRIFKEKFS